MSAVREVPSAPPRSSKAELAARLARSLAPGSVLVEREELKPYECDGLSAYRETPMVAAIPADEAEVAAVLQAARETRTPVVDVVEAVIFQHLVDCAFTGCPTVVAVDDVVCKSTLLLLYSGGHPI